MLASTVDMTRDELAAELSDLGPALPVLLRAEFENEYEIVRREARDDLTSTRVLLGKWRAVATAEQKDPGISHRVLAETAQLLDRDV
jgi:hypothetical protein